MKTQPFLLLLLFLATLLSSCTKDAEDTPTTASPVVFKATFDDQNELNGWSQSSGGQAVIDSSAVKFTNVTSCFHFETIHLIPVQAGAAYELHLTGKVNAHVPGDPVLCAGDFIIRVVQGDEYLISQSFGSYTGWTQRSFSFVANSSASLRIEFLVGTTRGAWIDHLELIII